MTSLAHGSGWDELLVFFVPILVYLVIIRPLLLRREQRSKDANQQEPTDRS